MLRLWLDGGQVVPRVTNTLQDYVNILHFTLILHITILHTGDNWSYEVCSALDKLSNCHHQQTNIIFYRPDALAKVSCMSLISDRG